MATNFSTNNISSISIQNKKYNIKAIPFHATEEEWFVSPLADYIPKQGEIVVYDVDIYHSYERFKIGDGTSTVSVLPFCLEEELLDALEKINFLADNMLNANYVGGALIFNKGITFPNT